MMSLYDFLNRLCTPAFLYAAMHIILLMVQLFHVLRQGILFRSDVISAFILNILYILAWAIGLNWLCQKNAGTISWVLVLAPFIAMLGFARKGNRYINLSDPNPVSAFM